MTHARTKVSDADISLFGPSQVRLGNEDMTHTQHAQASQLLGCVEHHWREPARHLGVQTYLDTSLNLVFTLH